MTDENAVSKVRALLEEPSGFHGTRVHQFTLHGYTYPFVESYGEAGLPDPAPMDDEMEHAGLQYEVSGARRHSMLGGLLLARPGDLLFFFQSDPQDPSVPTRRGIRGIFQVDGEPCAPPGDEVRRHPEHGDQYRRYGGCTACGSNYLNSLWGECPSCGEPLPEPGLDTPGDDDSNNAEHHLGLRLPVKPLVVFEEEVNDERAYADLSHTPLLWIGRHDNKMGRGKGSSIRQLLPEEAEKLADLLETTPDQTRVAVESVEVENRDAITNPDGTELEQVLWRNDGTKDRPWEVAQELMLHTATSLQLHNRESSLYECLEVLPGLQNIWNESLYLEYASSEVPWGYTGSTSDYALVFKRKEESKERHVVAIEFKKGKISDSDILQVWVYMPWLAQVFGQHLDEPGGNVSLSLIPVVVGTRFNGGREYGVEAIPEGYEDEQTYNSGVSVHMDVQEPTFWRYEPAMEKEPEEGPFRSPVAFSTMEHEFPRIEYSPPVGTATSPYERDLVRNKFQALVADRLNED